MKKSYNIHTVIYHFSSKVARNLIRKLASQPDGDEDNQEKDENIEHIDSTSFNDNTANIEPLPDGGFH